MTKLIFFLFASLMLSSAVLVVTIRNHVHAVLFLIFAFFNAAALLVLIGAEYIAMTLIVVYVGAVAVLFLFVVMMLDFDHTKLKRLIIAALPVAILLSGILFFEINWALRQSAHDINTSSVPNAVVQTLTNTEIIGMELYTKYALPFQISGLILLVAMIGAIILTISHTKRVRRQNVFEQLARTREGGVELVNVASSKGVKLP
jgi:NADH-quinone oxidoreductase subunit J